MLRQTAEVREAIVLQVVVQFSTQFLQGAVLNQAEDILQDLITGPLQDILHQQDLNQEAILPVHHIPDLPILQVLPAIQVAAIHLQVLLLPDLLIPAGARKIRQVSSI